MFVDVNHSTISTGAAGEIGYKHCLPGKNKRHTPAALVLRIGQLFGSVRWSFCVCPFHWFDVAPGTARCDVTKFESSGPETGLQWCACGYSIGTSTNWCQFNMHWLCRTRTLRCDPTVHASTQFGSIETQPRINWNKVLFNWLIAMSVFSYTLVNHTSLYIKTLSTFDDWFGSVLYILW